MLFLNGTFTHHLITPGIPTLDTMAQYGAWSGEPLSLNYERAAGPLVPVPAQALSRRIFSEVKR